MLFGLSASISFRIAVRHTWRSVLLPPAWRSEAASLDLIFLSLSDMPFAPAGPASGLSIVLKTMPTVPHKLGEPANKEASNADDRHAIQSTMTQCVASIQKSFVAANQLGSSRAHLRAAPLGDLLLTAAPAALFGPDLLQRRLALLLGAGLLRHAHRVGARLKLFRRLRVSGLLAADLCTGGQLRVGVVMFTTTSQQTTTRRPAEAHKVCWPTVC